MKGSFIKVTTALTVQRRYFATEFCKISTGNDMHVYLFVAVFSNVEIAQVASLSCFKSLSYFQ